MVSIGNNADVFFAGSSSLRWTSNVFRDEEDEVSDLLWVLSPGFELNVGRGLANTDLSVITRYDLIRYQDEGQLDTELLHIKALGSYKGSRMDLNGSVSFDETKTSTGDANVVQDLIEFDTFTAHLKGEYRLSPKFSLGAGVTYKEVEYTTYETIFSNQETATLPLDLFYELTPKVDLSIGYTHSTTDVGSRSQSFLSSPTALTTVTFGSYERDSHFFNVGARGNLLPKLTGSFKLGYRTRDTGDSLVLTEVFDLSNPPASTSGSSTTSRDDSGMLGLDADLTWSATPKLTGALRLSRDFGVSGEGQSTERTAVNTGLNYSLNQNFVASANAGLTLRDYSDSSREDQQYDLGLRLSYLPNQYWQFSTGYTYSENDSDSANSSYTNHMWDLSASLRY